MNHLQETRRAAHRAARYRAAARALIRYDPAGIAAAIEQAQTVEALRAAVVQLARLVEILAALEAGGEARSSPIT